MRKRKFTEEELRQYNGKNGMPAFIACEGKVYDVSNSFLWRNGRHQVMHNAGLDLTESIAQAPHGTEFLERFPVVGSLGKK
jgi:predicted heme/steroid binding protein